MKVPIILEYACRWLDPWNEAAGTGNEAVHAIIAACGSLVWEEDYMILIPRPHPLTRYRPICLQKRYTEGGAPVRNRAEVRVMGKLSGV